MACEPRRLSQAPWLLQHDCLAAACALNVHAARPEAPDGRPPCREALAPNAQTPTVRMFYADSVGARRVTRDGKEDIVGWNRT